MAELVNPLKIARTSLASFDNPDAMYEFAWQHVQKHRREEYVKILNDCSRPVDEHRFMREFLWVIYVSGFRASTIAKKYAELLRAHKIEDKNGNYIKPSSSNIFPRDRDYKPILKIFNNMRKATSVQWVRMILICQGWNYFCGKYVIWKKPELFETLPGIGPALSRHLSRNLGNLDVCKSDVHLKRLADKFGFSSVEELCSRVSSNPIGQTDLVIWLAAQDHGTLS